MVQPNIFPFILIFSILYSNYVSSQDDLIAPIQSKVELNLNVFLEGAFDPSTGLMTTNLLDKSLIPLSQPYNVPPYNYPGTEGFTSITNIPSKMVDWVLIEIRQGLPSATGAATTEVVEIKAGILLEDGKVVSSAGTPLSFDHVILENSYYILVRHRNHLDVLSANPIQNLGLLSYSFSNNMESAFSDNQLKLVADKYVMFAGDYHSDGIIQISDFNLWNSTPAVLMDYLLIDGNLDGVIQVTDFDIWKSNSSKVGPAEVQIGSMP